MKSRYPVGSKEVSSRSSTKNKEVGGADPISFKQINAFLAVAELRSITLAAKQLHVTQSALSRMINSLEAAAGDVLFARSTKGFVLTRFGADFMLYARRLHDCYTATLAVTAGVRERRCVLAACEISMPSVLPLLQAENKPGIETGMRLMANDLSSHLVIDAVVSGEADLGLCMYGGGRSDIHCTPLLNAPLGLLASPALMLPSSIRSLEDLSRVPMARLADDMVLPQLLRSNGIRFDTYFNARVTSNNMLAAIATAETGYFASIVSAVAASSTQAHGLRFIPLPHLLPPLQLCMVTRTELGTEAGETTWAKAIRGSVLRFSWLPSVERVYQA
jgi:DNA-binding transcriptional LysR family regulator